MNNSTPPSTTGGQLTNDPKSGKTVQPLHILKPLNLMVFMAYLSPIILASMITSLSFVFQNLKGFIYLACLVSVCFIRGYLFQGNSIYDNPVDANGDLICGAIQFSVVGNATFSIFVSCFTLIYFCFPMVVNSSMNWPIFGALIGYLMFDIMIKYVQSCLDSGTGVQLMIDSILGLVAGVVVTSNMYFFGLSDYLFFNETSSTKEVCTQPKQQTFKCSVYKNGELVT